MPQSPDRLSLKGQGGSSSAMVAVAGNREVIATNAHAFINGLVLLFFMGGFNSEVQRS